MKIFDVFTPGKVPTVTFVDDHLVKGKELFKNADAQGGMLINISGPSKSGKTVFVKNIVGAENLIAVSGSGIKKPDELWLRVFHQIGTPVGGSGTEEQNTTITIGGAVKTGGSILVAKGEVSASATGAMQTKEVTNKTVAIDSLQLLIKEMSNTDFVLFIDDFHYMGSEVQANVAQQIKEAIDKGVKIVCASVPHRSEDVLKANLDLRGRIVSIDFDYWPAASLRLIPQRGFAELNVDCPDIVLDRMVAEVAGSPQLMQTFCLNACHELGITSTVDVRIAMPTTEEFYANVCARTAVVADYSSTLEKLEGGPKTRGQDRKQYRLNDGTVGDVYTIVLQAIALDPPTLHFRYQELVERVKSLCEKETPSGSSVTGACLHISQLANDDQARPIIDWDSNEEVFDVRDPYLMFYLRWRKQGTA
jgi:hypothetical protein